MRSLRLRLIVFSLLVLAAAFVLAGALVHELFARNQLDALDAALESRVRAISAFCEQQDGEIHLEWLDPEDAERARPALPTHYICRLPDGRVFDASPTLRHATLPRAPEQLDAPLFQDLTVGDTRFRMVSLRFLPKGYQDAQQAAALELIAAEDTAPIDATLGRLRLVLAVAGLLGLALAGGVMAQLIRQQTRPLSRLAAAIAGLRTTRARVNVGRAPLELEPVIEQLNDLLTRLDEAREREREFTAAAAHELRTPLAGMRLKLELALSRPREAAELRTLAGDALGVSIAMQGLVEKLLSLARLESAQALGEPEPLDLGALVRDAFEPHARLAEQRGVSIVWDLELPGRVTARRAGLALIAGNLIENAVHYADEGSTITVQARADVEGIQLAVKNHASGLQPEDIERLGRPFWRKDEARSDAVVHAGLGLALCRRLAALMEGGLELGLSPNGELAAVCRVKA